jgi:predicted nucleic acid-binding protein
VRFWDTSAIVPLVVQEPRAVAVRQALRDDPRLIVWWATLAECVSAISRLEREGALTATEAARGLANLRDAHQSWGEIEPGDRLRDIAIRLLRTHPLTTADALQLAAAITAADGEPRSLPFVTLDDRLARAAEREGFPVLEPA